MRDLRRAVIACLASMCACTTEEAPAPPPVILQVEPHAICPTSERDPELVLVRGGGFVVNDDHTVATRVELWQEGHLDGRKVPLLEGDLSGERLLLAFNNGESAPPQDAPPEKFEFRVVNPDTQTAIFDDPFSIHSRFGFSTVTPTTASTGSTITLTIQGEGFYSPMRVILESQLSTFAEPVVVMTTSSVSALLDLTGVPPGTYAVTMRNEGRCSFTKVSAFTVTP